MVDIYTLQRAAHETTDENGNPVVQIPVEIWQQYFTDHTDQAAESKDNNPAADILALLNSWDKSDDESDEWWDEFDQFLRENRMNFPYDDSLFDFDEE